MTTQAVPIMSMPPLAVALLANPVVINWSLKSLDTAIETCSIAHERCESCQAVSECTSLYDRHAEKSINYRYMKRRYHANRIN